MLNVLLLIIIGGSNYAYRQNETDKKSHVAGAKERCMTARLTMNMILRTYERPYQNSSTSLTGM